MSDLIKCSVCRQCNRKGKKSVSRHSAYCDSHKKEGVKNNRVGLFKRFKDFISERRFDDKEKTMKTDGFRKSWFYR